MRKVLCVNPWITDFAAFDFWLKPVGLVNIASAVSRAGAEAMLLDLMDRNHPWLARRTSTDRWGRGKFSSEEIGKPRVLGYVSRKYRRYGIPRNIVENRLTELDEVDAILVTSSMTYWYPGVRETIELVKKRFPLVPIVLGGVYPTLLPNHARRFSGADVVLPGTWLSIKGKLEKVLGLKLPSVLRIPRWELYAELDYAVTNFSRGCPLSCTYCASYLIEPHYVTRPVSDVVKELVYLREIGIRRVAFYDDALLFHPELDRILEEIIGMDAGFEFHTPNGLHVSRITEERAALMKKAGFSSFYLSVETVDEELLERTGAKLSPAHFKKTARILQDAGFCGDQLHAYVLFGLPAQSENSVRKTIDLVLSCGVIPHLTEFSPVPGTVEYEKAGFNEDTDPLLTNNTAYCSRGYLKESWERLKEYLSLH